MDGTWVLPRPWRYSHGSAPAGVNALPGKDQHDQNAHAPHVNRVNQINPQGTHPELKKQPGFSYWYRLFFSYFIFASYDRMKWHHCYVLLASFFATNVIVGLYLGYNVYALLFFILMCTSLINHSTYHPTIHIIDRMAIISVGIYRSIYDVS